MRGSATDTIAAIATPPGAGALAIVRVSGPEALAVGDRIFAGTVRLTDCAGFTVHYGTVRDAAGEKVDEVLATVFRAPRSYTGEDMVEVSCHGGSYVARAVLDAVTGAGARPAEPGEFTRRAFLNGRIDLSQAEAVADVIAAHGRRGHRVSMEQLAGRLGDAVRSLRADMLDLCALLEIELDFSEEGLDLIDPAAIAARITAVHDRIGDLAASYRHGRIVRDGVSVVLAGEPNAGKSSLFNALLRQDRAIVTPVPGTTRDALEESIVINGILFRLTDTAGLRETADQVERIGVERSREVLSAADIVVHVMDASVAPTVHEHMQRITMHVEGQHFVPVLNKCDVLPAWPSTNVELGVPGSDVSAVPVSAQTGKGLGDLRDALARAVDGNSAVAGEGVTITHERHRVALDAAARSLEGAMTSLRSGAPREFITFDIREATTALAAITGEVTSEEVLNHIFERFCIGK